MTEIQDLVPDKPATEPPITSGQVGLYLKAKNAERPCEACGSTEFTMWPEPSGEEGVARGVVMLACDGCNATRQFLRPPIVTWLRSARLGEVTWQRSATCAQSLQPSRPSHPARSGCT